MKRIGILIFTLMIAGSAMAHSGHTDWKDWSFDWEVYDGAGLTLRNVRFKNELVIYKIGVPVIRVRYAGDVCGPYADQINWENLLKISNCGDAKVCQKSSTWDDGKQWLEIGILGALGKYRLYYAYYLREDGVIMPHLWSKGLHCDADHDHHVYWRADFDINGASGDQIFEWNNNGPDVGWGAGWKKYTNELNTVKNGGTNRQWFARDNSTSHGCWIVPGDDGSSDGFSTKDAAPRLYRGSEGNEWQFGAWGHLGFDNNENIEERDDVYWYVAHLHHEAAGGADHWHSVGPSLWIHR
ncbi:MAG: hypothetical protein ACJ74H_15235 [Thermoanaerobaculia bacterium]